MAFTARLKPELEAEARDLAESMGISLMALVAVALSEFVRARRPSGAPLSSSATPSGGGSSPAATSDPAPSKAPKGATPGRGPKPKPPPKVVHRSGIAAFHVDGRYVAKRSDSPGGSDGS